MGKLRMRNGIIDNNTREKSRFLYCEVHVDDMITLSSDNEFEKWYMNEIKQFVDMKNLGEATVLGIQLI